MIELVIEERCGGCSKCVEVCPMNVFEIVDGRPLIARKDDCQTCLLCELYCDTDALYVAPQYDGSVSVDRDAILASGLLGAFRRDSGWGEWSGDPRYKNEHWRMEEIFRRAYAGEGRGPGGKPVAPVGRQNAAA